MLFFRTPWFCANPHTKQRQQPPAEALQIRDTFLTTKITLTLIVAHIYLTNARRRELVKRESVFPNGISWSGSLNLATRGVLCLSFVVIFDLSGAGSRANAQAPGTGAIAGMVSDPSEAAVANARVTIVGED